MVRIEFLGGGQEVGRMGIVVDNGNQRFLMDYGVNVEDMSVPIQPSMPIDALLLSHAHLDHSGNIPTIYRQGWKGRVYATPATFDITNMLLKDSLKVQKIKGLTPKYGPSDIATVDQRGMNMKFGKPKEFKTAEVTFQNAGHIPGSSAILIETGDKRILYTGDTKLSETNLMPAAFSDYKDIDILITESTYSYKDHPPRKDMTKKIQDAVKQTHDSGGTCVLPCFAVGRTQEMLLIVSELGIPIYMDGMGTRATGIILNHPASLNGHDRLASAFRRAHKVRSNRQRKDALKNPSIIISTAGMLNGGPVHFYLKNLINDPKNTMILNGFQVPGTVGRTLLDTGRYVHEDVDIKPRMAVDFIDLSAHCGKSDIINLAKKLNPEKLVLVHGENTTGFSEEMSGLGFDSIAPKNGDVLEA